MRDFEFFRGFTCEPRRGGGRGGPGPFGGGFFGGFGGFGGPGGPFGPGRKFAAADLQLMILLLLEEKPRHGYELIKELEERTGGFYNPSPGVIYPALTYLEELGYASVEQSGTKKLYSLTPEGLSHLNENRVDVQAMMDRLEQIHAKMQKMKSFFVDEESGEDGMFGRHRDLHDARHALKSALRQKRGCNTKEAERIAQILRKAADEISGGN